VCVCVCVCVCVFRLDYRTFTHQIRLDPQKIRLHSLIFRHNTDFLFFGNKVLSEKSPSCVCVRCVCVCCVCVLLVQLHTFATRHTFDTLIATMMIYFFGSRLQQKEGIKNSES
jgi:hypothetical protein